MSTNNVNLDSLIIREDFDPSSPASKPGGYNSILAADLVQGRPLFSFLRKPDFQRETAIWTPDKVRDLVMAFVEEDLVPALILCRSANNHVFVIDGAHRLSSLIAWVNNDYGTGNLSNAFFENDVSANSKAAKKAKEMVEEAVGPYREIVEANQTPNSLAKYKQLSGKIINCALQVQWLSGEGQKAERSFFKINEQGVSLTNTELTLLYSRRCPNSIAARAINQRGTGHHHWKDFKEEHKSAIVQLAGDLHSSLFRPPLLASTVKTSELPIAGNANAASALPLLLETVNMTNGIQGITPNSKEDAEKLIPADGDGAATVNFLKRARKIVYRISNRATTDDMSSLDLHPLAYFYSNNGNHLPSSFLATVELMNEFEKNNSFIPFTLIRDRFENFLINHKDFVQQVSRSRRGQIKAVHKITDFLIFVVKQLQGYAGNGYDQHLVKALQGSPDFSFLKLPPDLPLDDFTEPSTKSKKSKKGFAPGVKSKKMIAYELEKAACCYICNARIPSYAMSFDHAIDKKHGGSNAEENVQFTHHFCNSAKDAILAAKTKAKAAKAGAKKN